MASTCESFVSVSNSFEGMMLTPPDHGLPDQDVVEWAFGKNPSSSDFRKFNGGDSLEFVPFCADSSRKENSQLLLSTCPESSEAFAFAKKNSNKKKPTAATTANYSPSSTSKTIRRGAVKSEEEKRVCIKCKQMTQHNVGTYWVACNDYRNKKKSAKYTIYNCLQCNAEYSPCRECCKKAKDDSAAARQDSLSKLYMWVKDDNAVTKYSLHCTVCDRKHVRCNYCKAWYKHYAGRKGHHTRDNCRFLKCMREMRSNTGRKKKHSDNARSCGRPAKMQHRGYGPDSDPSKKKLLARASKNKATTRHAVPSPTKARVDGYVSPPKARVEGYASPKKLHVDGYVEAQLEGEAGQLEKEAPQLKVQATSQADQLRSRANRLRNLAKMLNADVDGYAAVQLDNEADELEREAQQWEAQAAYQADQKSSRAKRLRDLSKLFKNAGSTK